MTRATLLRVLLAVALATATCADETRAQQSCPPRNLDTNNLPRPCPQAPSDTHNNKWIGYLVGGVVIAVIAIILANPPWADPGPPPPPPQPPLPPNLPPVAQLPSNPAPLSKGAAKTTQLRPGCNLPPAGETRFVPTHVIAQGNLSAQRLGEIAAGLNLTPLDDLNGRLVTGLHLLRIDGGASVPDV